MNTVEKIFSLMAMNKITAKQLAQETGISQSNFTEWKKGRSKPKINAIQAIANYFNVPVEQLISDGEPQKKQEVLLFENSEPLILEMNISDDPDTRERILKIRNSISEMLNGMNEQELKRTEQVISALKN